MKIDAGTLADLTPELMTELARYRHKVFVEKLGWKLTTEKDLELDQFDRPDTLYVIAQNDDEQVIGTARLLPTIRPYLLSEIFPQLLGGTPIPRSQKIWELSRFAAVDFNARRTSALSQFSPPVASALLRTAIGAAAERGAERLITVSPVGVERLLRKAEFQAHRAGPPIVVGGEPLFACWIECVDNADCKALESAECL
jgi:N-acyl-L-homoserine lactone synthetase